MKMFVLLLVLFMFMFGCEPESVAPRQGCSRPKVIAFTATWCEPCRAAKGELERLRSHGVDVQEVDIDANPEMTSRYEVTSVPTFFVYVCGRKAVRTQDIYAVAPLIWPRG